MSLTGIKEHVGPSIQQAKIRGHNIQCCLDELAQGLFIEAFEGCNSNNTGKTHRRWRLLSDPDQPVARPTRRGSSSNPAGRNGSRRQRRPGAAP
jgi:hypothetical protein